MEKEYCTLDNRTVIIPESYKEIGVEYDDSANRIWFRFPKIVGDDVDLSTMRIQINYHNAFGEADIYPVDDAVGDGEYIIFSWLLDDKVTKYRGNIGFVVRAGSEDRKWNTALCKKCTVLKGLDCSKQIEKQNPEIIEYILAKLDAAITISPEDIAVAVEGYMKENPITANDIGADPEGTAESKISEHNTAPDAHNDIRLLVQRLTERLSALADSDDTTLDQMSEIVAYIKSNKSLIDVITTSKINVSDIIDNLTTNVSNKPLSAAQGAKLKALIDAIPTVELDETLTDNTKAAPAGMVGELKSGLTDKVSKTDYAPETKTDSMSQPVGKDENGKLWTAPSFGDSGIAVTGATVGQTVKIAAVDENGVPTAWEPVDLPGGGGEEWDELANVTLEEESLPVIDIGDYAVNFKKLRFFIALESMTPHNVIFALSIPNATTGLAYNVCNIVNFGNASGVSKAFIEFEPLIEEGFCRVSYAWATPPATSTKASSFSYQYNSYDYGRLKTARYFRPNVQLPAGTMIVIKGVRV